MSIDYDQLQTEIDEISDEILRLQAWIDDNPSYIAGVLEKERKIRQLKYDKKCMIEDLHE